MIGSKDIIQITHGDIAVMLAIRRPVKGVHLIRVKRGFITVRASTLVVAGSAGDAALGK